MNGKKLLLKNIFSLGIVQVSNLVLPLITLPVIARIIGPDKFGVINYASAVIAYFTLIINYGFDMTATREVARYNEDKDKISSIFSNILYTKIGLVLLSLIAFAGMMLYLPALKTEKMVAIFSFLICIAWVITPNWLYQGMQDLKMVAVFTLLSKILFTIFVLVLIKQKQDYTLQPLILSLSQIGVGVIAFSLAFRKYKVRLVRFRIKAIIETLNNGKTIFFSLLTINLYTYTSVVILGLFQSSTEIGYYTAANRLISVAQAVLFVPVNQSLFPYIGAAFGRSREEGLELIKKFLPPSVLFSFIYCLMILLFSPLIVKLLFGASFTGAVHLLRILSFVPLVINISTLLGVQGMVNLKMDRAFLKITFIGALFSLPINTLMAKYFGAEGTAITYLLTEVLICILFYARLKRASINLIQYNYFNAKSIYNQAKGFIIVKVHTSKSKLSS